MMCKTDITPRFLLDQIDHHEFLDILTIRYKTCWRVSKREITFPATHDYRLKLRIRHVQVEQVYAGKALTEADLCQLLEQVEADLKDDRIAEYGVEILFAHKPVTGGFRFGAIRMQFCRLQLKPRGRHIRPIIHSSLNTQCEHTEHPSSAFGAATRTQWSGLGS